MKNLIEKITQIEEHTTISIDLLEIVKSYCNYNFDKGSELATIGTVIDLILKEQKALAESLDSVAAIAV